jgi:hypothetical protein
VHFVVQKMFNWHCYLAQALDLGYIVDQLYEVWRTTEPTLVMPLVNELLSSLAKKLPELQCQWSDSCLVVSHTDMPFCRVDGLGKRCLHISGILEDALLYLATCNFRLDSCTFFSYDEPVTDYVRVDALLTRMATLIRARSGH